MKLSSDDISNLINILNTCNTGDIETIIIEDGFVRGVNEARNFVILSNEGVPTLPQKMGLGRLNAIRQRMDLFATNTSTVINVVESDRGEISSIEISAGKNKVQARCMSTVLIKAPKVINDPDDIAITLSKDEMKLLLNAVKVMGSAVVQLIVKSDGTVHFIASDESNDAFNMTLDSSVEWLSDDVGAKVHYYHANIFLAVLRKLSDMDEVIGIVGAAGTFKTQLNGHMVYILSKIDEDADEE